MPDLSTITAIVSTALKDAPLPASWTDADLQTQRRVQRMAEAQSTTPEAIWSAIKAQQEHEDAAAEEASSVAKAARR